MGALTEHLLIVIALGHHFKVKRVEWTGNE